MVPSRTAGVNPLLLRIAKLKWSTTASATRYLFFGSHFNQSLEHLQLPKKLKDLIFGEWPSSTGQSCCNGEQVCCLLSAANGWTEQCWNALVNWDAGLFFWPGLVAIHYDAYLALLDTWKPVGSVAWRSQELQSRHQTCLSSWQSLGRVCWANIPIHPWNGRIGNTISCSNTFRNQL